MYQHLRNQEKNLKIITRRRYCGGPKATNYQQIRAMQTYHCIGGFSQALPQYTDLLFDIIDTLFLTYKHVPTSQLEQ